MSWRSYWLDFFAKRVVTSIAMNTRTLTTKKGRTVVTPYSDESALMLCQGLDNDFAQELFKRSRGKPANLSPDQMTWVHILVVDAMNRVSDDFGKPRVGDTGAPKAVTVGSFEGLVNLFKTAASSLKRPGLLLKCGDQTIRIRYRDGEIRIYDRNVKDWSEKYQQDLPRYYGKVVGEKFQPYGKNPLPGLEDLLRRMSADPDGTAAEYGKLTGFCCYCGNRLEDERSTSVGYGPICAKSWGRPWGYTIGVDMASGKPAAIAVRGAMIPGSSSGPRNPDYAEVASYAGNLKTREESVADAFAGGLKRGSASTVVLPKGGDGV